MGAVLLDEQTAPGTPSAGQVVLYPKTDGFLYSKDDAGTETQLAVGGITLGTPIATTSGTSHDFTGLPSGVRRITVSLVGVSTNGTSNIQIQLGDSGGPETSGYVSNAFGANNTGVIGTTASAVTTGIILMSVNAAAATWHGAITFTLENSSDFTWVATGGLTRGDTGTIFFCAGSKALSAALDRVRITTVNGTDTFDAGSVNIAYE